MSRILLLEDDDSLGATLLERLLKEGYQVDWHRSLLAAKTAVIESDYDIAILDVGLPDGSGFEFAADVKGRKGMPFLFLTAMATAEYRLQGYELGAEEFIPKPFHLKELLMRVRHVLENHSKLDEFQLGQKYVNFSRMSVTDKSGGIEYLSAKDCQVLKLLVESAPNVVSRDKILEEVWGREKFPTNRTVDNVILRLRQILGDSESQFIRTVRGIGYQIVISKGDANG